MSILKRGLYGTLIKKSYLISTSSEAKIREQVKFRDTKLGHIFLDWVMYITFFAVFIKTLLLTGLVQYEDNSPLVQITVFQNLSSPLFYICFIAVLFSFSYLFSKRRRLWFLIGLDIFLSVIYLMDLWYYRGYSDFLTINLFLHTLNWEGISQKLVSAISFSDFIYIMDVVLLLILAIRKKDLYKNMTRCIPMFILIFTLSVCYINYKNNEAKEKHQNLFDVLWAPGETILNLSPVGYHAFDTYNFFTVCRTGKLSSERKQAISEWFDGKKEELPDNEYKAIYKGKNLLYIQVESLENFVINQKINGKDITPNINSLIKNSIYFSNYRDQANHGNSSDGDLLMNTSVYPLKEGGTFMLHPYTSYNSLPKLLGKLGYSTLTVKPDKPSGWNWVQALTSIGYQKCIDINSFDVDEKIGLGLSDGSYLKQLEPIIEKQKEPFFTFLVTLSSHSPFEIPDKYRELDLPDNLKYSTMGGYLDSVHYTDKHIGIFLESLKGSGLLKNTVVVISADHGSLHRYSDETRYGSDQYDWLNKNEKRLPFIIYYEGMKGKEIKVNGGQIDALPTIAYLMGIDEKEVADTAMGRNLLKTRKDFAVYSTGSYSGTFTSEAEKNSALDGLNVADDIIRGNYFK